MFKKIVYVVLIISLIVSLVRSGSELLLSEKLDGYITDEYIDNNSERAFYYKYVFFKDNVKMSKSTLIGSGFSVYKKGDKIVVLSYNNEFKILSLIELGFVPLFLSGSLVCFYFFSKWFGEGYHNGQHGLI